MSWRVARSLDTLLTEINAAAPNRSKISDGSIGDPSHSSRESDHNPNENGVVRARDFTNDPANGCDSQALAEAVRQLGIKGHPALTYGAYVISNRRIASATHGWDWRAYTGTNPHDHHCHVSVALAASGYDSTARWGVLEVDDMAEYGQEILDAIGRLEDREKKRDQAERARTKRHHQATLALLDNLIAEVADVATKRQVRHAREEIAALGAEDDAEVSGV